MAGNEQEPVKPPEPKEKKEKPADPESKKPGTAPKLKDYRNKESQYLREKSAWNKKNREYEAYKKKYPGMLAKYKKNQDEWKAHKKATADYLVKKTAWDAEQKYQSEIDALKKEGDPLADETVRQGIREMVKDSDWKEGNEREEAGVIVRNNETGKLSIVRGEGGEGHGSYPSAVPKHTIIASVHTHPISATPGPSDPSNARDPRYVDRKPGEKMVPGYVVHQDGITRYDSDSKNDKVVISDTSRYIKQE